jgi:hypothetical protein
LNVKCRGNYLINTNYFSIFSANFLGNIKKNLLVVHKKTPPTRTGRAPHEKKWTLTLQEKPMLANASLTKGQLKGIPDNTTNW